MSYNIQYVNFTYHLLLTDINNLQKVEHYDPPSGRRYIGMFLAWLDTFYPSVSPWAHSASAIIALNSLTDALIVCAS